MQKQSLGDMTSIPNCNRQCDYCHCALCEERKPQESVAYTISATDIKEMRQREREHYMSLSKEQLVDIIMGGNDYPI